MLSKKKDEVCLRIGTVTAHTMFATMLNPKYRGGNFRWCMLEDTAANLARIHVGLADPTGRGWGLDSREMEDLAGRWARHTVRWIFRESGVEEWLPLGEKEEK